MPQQKKSHDLPSIYQTNGKTLPNPPLRRSKPDPRLLIETFLSGRTLQTRRSYQNDLSDFTSFLGAGSPEEAVTHILEQDQADANTLALSYRQNLIERKLAPSTVNRRLTALRSLLKLARLLGLCSYSIEVGNLTIEPYRDTRGPGREGVVRILRELKRRRDAKGARDRAMIHLLYDLALRRSEVVSLDLSDLDLEGKAIWVLGKGRNSRQRLTLPPETCDALTAWVKARKKLTDESGPLFLSLSPAHPEARLTDSGLYRIVRGLGEKVGLKVRPHGLRHAAITEALDATRGDVRAVQRFSRHKSLNVLLVYDDQRRDLAGEVSRLVARSTRTPPRQPRDSCHPDTHRSP